jgi:hypothetical protein
VGLEAAGAVLETGGDVICVDSHDVPSATDAWSKSPRRHVLAR